MGTVKGDAAGTPVTDRAGEVPAHGTGGLTPAEQRRGMAKLFYFAAFNSLSFEIIGGQILVLFARQVGASLMQIGLLTSFMPFATVIQLGIAPLVNRFGPKAIMFTGWTARTVVAAFLPLVPLAAARWGPDGATMMLLVIMAFFYLFRALGVSSWLPLLQEIVPPRMRGEYLSKQEVVRHLAIITASLLTAVYLLGKQDLAPYLHVMTLGVISGAVGLIFLRGLPHVAASMQPVDREFFRQALQPLRNPGFRHYLAFSGSLRFATMGIPSFLILFLRDQLHRGPSTALFLITLSSAGAAASLFLWGRLVDRFGSRPILKIGLVGTVVTTLLWAAIEPVRWMLAGVVPLAAVLQGICAAGLGVAIIRLELGMVPREGREHYVAATITLAGIAAGLSPLAGGALLHAFEGVAWHLGPFTGHAYRAYFLATTLLCLIPLALSRGLKEPFAPSMRRAIRVAVGRATRRRKAPGSGH